MTRLTKQQRKAVIRNLKAKPNGRFVPRWFIANSWEISLRQLRRIEVSAGIDGPPRIRVQRQRYEIPGE